MVSDSTAEPVCVPAARSTFPGVAWGGPQRHSRTGRSGVTRPTPAARALRDSATAASRPNCRMLLAAGTITPWQARPPRPGGSGPRGPLAEVAPPCHDRYVAAIIWLIAAAALAVAEAFTTTFVLLMLAAGALAAAGAAALDASVVTQGIVFGVVSGLALVAVRPFARRHLARTSAPEAIGVEAIAGSSGVVLERVDADSGLVKIEGDTWTARAYDATQVLEPGDRIEVIEIRGATAMVWRNS